MPCVPCVGSARARLELAWCQAWSSAATFDVVAGVSGLSVLTFTTGGHLVFLVGTVTGIGSALCRVELANSAAAGLRFFFDVADGAAVGVGH